MKKLKVISKKYVNEPIKVYDIEVQDEHHYFLENGLLSHNSMSMFTSKEISGGGGLKYNASIIFMLSKGKLDDAEGEKRAKEIVRQTKSDLIEIRNTLLAEQIGIPELDLNDDKK